MRRVKENLCIHADCAFSHDSATLYGMAKDVRHGALQYIRFVLDHTKASPSALAKEAGLSPSTLNRPLNDPSHSFTLSTTTLEKIRDATGLDFTPFITKDMDTLARSIDILDNANEYHPEDFSEPPGPSTIIAVMGEVGAGIWREVQFGDLNQLFAIFLTPSREELRAHTIGLMVRGESLNRIARERDVLICESIAGTGTEPRDGDLVIVERQREQEGLIEVTAKRLKIVRNKKELWPESDDPRYQTAIKLSDKSPETVRIIGIVHYIVRQP